MIDNLFYDPKNFELIWSYILKFMKFLILGIFWTFLEKNLFFYEFNSIYFELK